MNSGEGASKTLQEIVKDFNEVNIILAQYASEDGGQQFSFDEFLQVRERIFLHRNDDGEIIGLAIIEYSQVANSAEIFLFVDKDYREKSIFFSLLRGAINMVYADRRARQIMIHPIFIGDN